jgi:trans-2,3-dihydro-3-hydroxyanthranilate isomerase
MSEAPDRPGQSAASPLGSRGHEDLQADERPRSGKSNGAELPGDTGAQGDPAWENRAVPTYRYVVADVFTETALAGNQLAVFTDAREIPETQLQALAREMNFSETVFVYPPEAEGHVRLRIFTPTAEMELAGHPVLGTAFVLAGPLQLGVINIETPRALIPVELQREGPRIVFGWMRLPVPEVTPFDREEELLAALRVERADLPVELYDLGIRHVMVALASPDDVAAVEPDLLRLARLQGVIGTSCFAGDGLSWKTRMFAPADGVPEDPATGSAAGPLALHLARHGRIGWGDEIEISQGTEVGRPSTLHARVFGSEDVVERVEVGGSAVIVARGEFRL